MKDAYTIEEVTDMLHLKAQETIRRYVRNGKDFTFEEIQSTLEPNGEVKDPYYGLELTNPGKRPYTITRRSLILFLERKALLSQEQINDLLTNFEANQAAEDNADNVQPAKPKKKIHHILGIPYSYNSLSRKLDKLSKSVKSTIASLNDPETEIKAAASEETILSPETNAIAFEDTLQLAATPLQETSSLEETKNSFQKALSIINELSRCVDQYTKEIEKLNADIDELERVLQKRKEELQDLKTTRDEFINKREEAIRYFSNQR